jgi:hypothetical protein
MQPSWAQAPTLQEAGGVNTSSCRNTSSLFDADYYIECKGEPSAGASLSFVSAGAMFINGGYSQIEDINGGPAYEHTSGDFVIRRSKYGYWLLVTAKCKLLSNNCLYWHPSKTVAPPLGHWECPGWVRKHMVEDAMQPSWGQAPILQQVIGEGATAAVTESRDEIDLPPDPPPDPSGIQKL